MRGKRKRRLFAENANTIEHSYPMRLTTIFVFVFISCVSLIARMAYLQVSEVGKFRGEETTTSLNAIPALPPRGRIYDSNGILLAYDSPIYDLLLTQSQVNSKQLGYVASVLAPVFHTTVAGILSNVQSQQQYATINLFKNLNQQQLAFVMQHRSDLPGVTVELASERQYQYGDLAGHVLGYTGPITSSSVNYYVNKLKYLPNEQVGETGIESEYNNLLEGKVGEILLSGNSSSTTPLPPGVLSPPVAGNNLQLTLDGHLQAVTQENMTTFINNSPYKSTINDAAAVMLDVKTGGVLSLVSYPYLNPNWYTVPGQFGKHTKYLATSGAQQNNAIQNPNYPGSTVKPANLITGLENHVITPSTAYYVPYNLQIAGALKHDDMPHGFLNDATAITVSSDVFFYQLGLGLAGWTGASPTSGGGPTGGVSLQQWRNVNFAKGMTKLFNGEWRFGLGQITGIDLPGEQRGNFFIMDQNKQYAAVPFPLQQANKSIRQTGGYVNYSTPVSIALASIGQEQQYTPIQLAQYVATIASGGRRIQPHLLQAVYPPQLSESLFAHQKRLMLYKPKVQANLSINPQYLTLAQEGMYGVCNNPLGTAYPDFQGAPYRAAGKTGTADIYLNGVHMTNSVFIGYAPYNNPQVAIAVMIPGGGYGAESAALVARNMMDTYFKEHHEFFPKSQWQSATIPVSWLTSPSNTVFNTK